nr:chemoreceptor glutamine deamidase CheD [Nitrospirota bacterium]
MTGKEQEEANSGVRVTDFPHIRRMRDSRCPHEIAAILPGQFFVSDDEMIVYTVLGSCISVCIRDPVAGVGGMNHFMLPAPKNDDVRTDAWGESGRYGSYAMELLINEILKRGGMKQRFEVKVFGGGKIYNSDTDVGAGNAAWASRYLANEGLPPVSMDVGGPWPRKIYYFTDSGRVLMKKIRRIKNQTIVEREEQYEHILLAEPKQSNVTLF